MQKKRDYYEELEIDRKATAEQIREAYKRLALVLTPAFTKIEMASRQEREFDRVEGEVPKNWRGICR